MTYILSNLYNNQLSVLHSFFVGVIFGILNFISLYGIISLDKSYYISTENKKAYPKNGYAMVGVTGFEPAASWSRTKRSTKLSHTPAAFSIISQTTKNVKRDL